MDGEIYHYWWNSSIVFSNINQNLKIGDRVKSFLSQFKDWSSFDSYRYDSQARVIWPEIDHIFNMIENLTNREIDSFSLGSRIVETNNSYFPPPEELNQRGWICIDFMFKNDAYLLTSSYSVFINPESLDIRGPYWNNDEG